MQKVIFLFSLSIFSLLSACSTGDPNDKVKVPVTEKKVVYVLFDYSKSLDTSSIKSTAKNAFDLIKSCPEGVTMMFFPIDNDPFGKPVFSYTQTPMPSKPKEVALWKKKKGDSAAEIFNKILGMYKNSNINSCIVHGFSTIYNHVKTIPSRDDVQLIVLSDLLECCDNTTCAQSVMGFQKLIKEIGQYKLETYPMKQYISYNNIRLVTNSSKSSKILEIYHSPNQEFEQFWTAVAKGMGYEKGFVISQELPGL